MRTRSEKVSDIVISELVVSELVVSSSSRVSSWVRVLVVVVVVVGLG